MSPRAAWRLESLLFDRVYDYVAGKNDWISHGLPIEGEIASHQHLQAGDFARKDVPTCQYTDRLGYVSSVVPNGKAECVVLNGEDVVLGRLREEAFNHDLETPVEQIMEPGPTTVRPGTPLEEITQRMQQAGVHRVLVTNAEGKFAGVLYLEDAKEQLAQTSGNVRRA